MWATRALRQMAVAGRREPWRAASGFGRAQSHLALEKAEVEASVASRPAQKEAEKKQRGYVFHEGWCKDTGGLYVLRARLVQNETLTVVPGNRDSAACKEWGRIVFRQPVQDRFTRKDGVVSVLTVDSVPYCYSWKNMAPSAASG